MASWCHCTSNRFECNICVERIESTQAQRKHEVDDHHYRQDCDRFFMSLNNIRQADIRTAVDT